MLSGNYPYWVTYAASDRTKCVVCNKKIIKDQLRIAWILQSPFYDGNMAKWHHVECLSKTNEIGTISDIGNFDNIRWKDQEYIKNLIAIKENSGASSDVPSGSSDSEQLEKLLKQQNNEFFEIRDEISKLRKPVLTRLLKFNKQHVPTNLSELRDAVADAMLFGAMQCPECTCRMKYVSAGYKCQVSLYNDEEYVIFCDLLTQTPSRDEFYIPKKLKQLTPFLSSFVSILRNRLFRENIDTFNERLNQTKTWPLRHVEFVIDGKSEKKKGNLKQEILLLGGDVVYKVSKNTAAVISTFQAVQQMTSHAIEEAQIHDVHVVSKDLIKHLKKSPEFLTEFIKKTSVAPWGSDPQERISKSITEKSGVTKSRMRAYEVDPRSGLEDVAHVYSDNFGVYNTTLNYVHIQSNKNTYYKLQIYEHDVEDKYWLFLSWGRTGTTIGGYKCKCMPLSDCIAELHEIFNKKTNNDWMYREEFEYDNNGVNMNYHECLSFCKPCYFFDLSVESKLKPQVYELVKSSYDKYLSNKTWYEYEADLNLLPLGLSRNSKLHHSLDLLDKISANIESDTPDRKLLLGLSNAFYMLVPHSFGFDRPKIIETKEDFEREDDLVNSLIDGLRNDRPRLVPLDHIRYSLNDLYDRLNANIDVLDSDSEMYKLIEKYAVNTLAEEELHLKVKVTQVYSIDRHGEKKRFEPFENSNRKLLWRDYHLQNLVGIMSGGLKLPPAEAPDSSYGFGKGIYFADMLSEAYHEKESNHYNCTMLLCDVALGNSYECCNKEDINDDYLSFIESAWARGQVQPNPEESVKVEGFEVPCGLPVPVVVKDKDLSLPRNRYIVYDEARVKMKYLVQLNFYVDYSYLRVPF